jgi:hypothetical protein
VTGWTCKHLNDSQLIDYAPKSPESLLNLNNSPFAVTNNCDDVGDSMILRNKEEWRGVSATSCGIDST